MSCPRQLESPYDPRPRLRLWARAPAKRLRRGGACDVSRASSMRGRAGESVVITSSCWQARCSASGLCARRLRRCPAPWTTAPSPERVRNSPGTARREGLGRVVSVERLAGRPSPSREHRARTGAQCAMAFSRARPRDHADLHRGRERVPSRGPEKARRQAGQRGSHSSAR
jgi:hypothetical protein